MSGTGPEAANEGHALLSFDPGSIRLLKRRCAVCSQRRLNQWAPTRCEPIRFACNANTLNTQNQWNIANHEVWWILLSVP
jgi:hypothetical protein